MAGDYLLWGAFSLLIKSVAGGFEERGASPVGKPLELVTISSLRALIIFRPISISTPISIDSLFTKRTFVFPLILSLFVSHLVYIKYLGSDRPKQWLRLLFLLCFVFHLLSRSYWSTRLQPFSRALWLNPRLCNYDDESEGREHCPQDDQHDDLILLIVEFLDALCVVRVACL